MRADLSILLATHNGARWIGRMLDGYAAQAFAGTWELVIVDNASTDDTAQIVRSYADRLPITYRYEGGIGKNRALNTGLAATTSDLVILTDDDAPPREGFLEAWASLHNRFADYDLFGGRVTAEFQEPPPPWITRLTQLSEAVFAQRDLPTGPIRADEIFGPNMCVRRRVFDAGFKFDEKIGPNGADSNYPMGSETEFCLRAEAAGFKACFFADPWVGHIVRPNQVTQAYFDRVAYRAGRRDAMMAAEAGTLSDNLWRDNGLRRFAPAWLQQALLVLRATLARDPVQRNFRLWRLNWWRGYMDRARTHREDGPTPAS